MDGARSEPTAALFCRTYSCVWSLSWMPALAITRVRTRILGRFTEVAGTIERIGLFFGDALRCHKLPVPVRRWTGTASRSLFSPRLVVDPRSLLRRMILYLGSVKK